MAAGRRQFVNDPPLLVRLHDLLTEEQKNQIPGEYVEQSWFKYISSLPEERRLLLSRFRPADAALRVGGVGSVGTRCSILLLEGSARKDAIILQQKEAGPSVLETYLPERGYENHAHRVVTAQRLLQAASDIFLGWHRSPVTENQFYWRQLKDMKGSVDVATLDQTGLGTYLGVCSASLARAHARTSDPSAIAGYLGKGEAFDKAIGEFALQKIYQGIDLAAASPFHRGPFGGRQRSYLNHHIIQLGPADKTLDQAGLDLQMTDRTVARLVLCQV